MIDRHSLNSTMLVAGLAIVALVLALFMQASTVVSSFLATSEVDDDSTAMIARLHDASRTTLDADKARFDGRSVYRKPKKTVVVLPPAPRITTPKVDEEPKVVTPPPEPPKPTKPPYDGPSVRAMIGDTVLFAARTSDESPRRISVGQELDDLKVVSTNPPWKANVEWKGWDYELALFTLSPDFFKGDDKLDPELPGLIDVDTTTADAADTAETVQEMADDDPEAAKAEAEGSGDADEDDSTAKATETVASSGDRPVENPPTPIDRAKKLGPGGGRSNR